MGKISLSFRWLWKSCVGGLVAFAGIHASLAQTLPVTSAGATPGTFDVSPTGQATYTIPLWMPPGINGVAPKLALSYSSNNRAAGWISPGWSLSGLSQITRCQKTIEYDEAISPVNLSRDDAYCLDGQRLESYDGIYGTADSSYRTKIDDYTLVTAKESAGNGPAWFEVTRTDGLIYEYGRTANSRAMLAGGTTPYAWSLSKIRDRQGNNLVVDYLSSSSALLPATIRFTQSPAIGASYPYTVVFNYASRDADDTLTGYISGSQFSLNRRLDSIDVRFGGTNATLLRRYRLTYTDSPTTQRARLAAVQECSGSSGANCLSPTTITYQNGQIGIAAPSSAVGSLPVYNELRVADVNGDARSDLIYSIAASSGYHEWYVSLASTSGFLPPINTGLRIWATDYRSELLIGDFIGLGRVQLLAPNESSVWCMWKWGHDGLPERGCSNVSVDPTTILGTAPGEVDAPSYAAADINGDGRSDLVWAASTDGLQYVWARLSTGAIGYGTFGQPMPLYPIPDLFAGLYGSYGPASAAVATDRLDFNGDSREDLVLVTGRSNQIQVVFTARQLLANTNVQFATGPTLSNYFGWPRAVHWNDDACTDLQFSSMIHLSACNGTEGQTIAVPQGQVHLDWNGDGRTDVLYPSGGVWAARLSQGAQASSELSTGIAYAANVGLIPLDYDADGLIDLISLNSTTRALAVGLHQGAGTPADLLSSVVDGLGNRFSPTYTSITRGSYSPGPWEEYPAINRMTPLYVVNQFSASDATGGTYTNQFEYSGALWNARGLGFLGFYSRRTLDSRTALYRYETYSRDFPTIGWLRSERIVQANNLTVRSIENTLAARQMWLNERYFRFVYFPYVQRSVIRNYEAGGSRNGELIATREVTNTYGDWGALLTQTVTTTEGGTGLNSGAAYTEVVTASDVRIDSLNWCLNKPGRVQHTRRHSLTGGTEITRTTSYDWDMVNCRLNRETTEPDSTRWAVTTDYEYDNVGNLNEVTVTPAAGQGQAPRTTAINWGGNGRFPRTLTNPKNQQTSFGWDEERGVLTSVTDANGLTTTSSFDNFNRPTRESRHDGTATDISYHVCSASFVYCAADDVRTYQQVVTRDTANNAVRTDIQSFDSLGRTRYTYRQLLSGAMSGEITTYNSRGLVSSVSMPFIQGEPIWYTTISYDALGRPSTIERPISEANSGMHLTRFGYEGLSTVTTDALNRPSTRWVNAIGNIVRAVDTGNNATHYEYDAFGNLLMVRDAAGNEMSMSYNVRGMKMSSSDPDAGAWAYDYFPLGELKSQTDANSQTTTFTYDALSRLLTRVDGDGITEFTYDTAGNGVGQRATASSPGYLEAYSYDTFGRLSQTRISADGANYQYDYGYEPNTGLLQYLTYPTSSSGFRFKVRYDYQYGLMQKVSNYTGDVPGTVYWEAIATNARGQYIDEQYGNGLRTISGYDRIAGWLDDRTTARSGATSLQNFTYQWDELGNLTQRQDAYNNTIENFYYDSLDRLDYAALNGTINLDLAYDAIGNITSKSGVGSYTYHPVKRHAVVSTSGTINNTYAYDANGNMVTRNGQPITWYRNHLPKKISASAGVSNEFWYGPDGSRWKQVSVNGTGTGTWTYIGGLVERLVTPTVNEFRHYIQGPNGVVAVYKRQASGSSPSTTYVSRDHLGSLDVISNTAGVEIADAAFSAFGARVDFTGSGPPSADDLRDLRNATRRGFTFHEHLDDAGLIHMNGRVYDPVLARFISPDPFVQNPFNGQNLNRYSYVLNNPLRYVDPTGFNWDSLGGVDWTFGWSSWLGGGKRGYDCIRNRCNPPPAVDPENGMPWHPQRHPDRPSSTPPTPPPPTFVRPVNPTLPPADTAVPGIGQPVDAVSTVSGDQLTLNDYVMLVNRGYYERVGIDIGQGMTLMVPKRIYASSDPVAAAGLQEAEQVLGYAAVGALLVIPGPEDVAIAGAFALRGVGYLDDLSRAAAALDRGGLTVAGRQLQKHGNRPNSAFPAAQGNPSAINQRGQQIVDDILSSPGATFGRRHHARFGDVIEVRAPDGRGLRYSATGRFIGFLEPKP